ncbi:MAG: hypothetical protein M3Y23_04620 [Actinomycetota bacterium]|nr:hypothetical protein [Actinomycetota bacterium]
MRETSRHLNRILGGAVTFLAAAAILAGCGGDDEEAGQFANEPAGEYPVEVISAEFEPRQTIAETYNLVLAVRNTGDEAVPGLTTTISLPGRGSTLAFAYRDPQPGLAMPQRPVWVLEQGYPKLAGTKGRGGAGSANRRTFNFGAVEPGDVAKMVWRVTAVRPGNYRLAYQVAAGLSGEANAVDNAGDTPEGVLPARISDIPIVTEIDDQGNVVPLDASDRLRLKMQEEDSSP